MRSTRCLTIVFLVLASIPSILGQTSPSPDLAGKAAAATIVVTGFDENRTSIASARGFFVSDSLFLAEFGVIRRARTFQVQLPDGSVIDTNLRGVDDSRRVGLFSVMEAQITPLALGAPVNADAADADLRKEGFVIRPEGSVINVTADMSIRPAQHSTLGEESWGSPVFGAAGEVIGIVVSDARGDFLPFSSINGLQYAVPALGPRMIVPRVPASNDSTPAPIATAVARAPQSGEAGENRPGGSDQSRVIRKSSGILAGEAIRRAQPIYPALAKAARISGSVQVEIVIGAEGEVVSARALAGHPLLKECAVAAARGWLFKPTLLSGSPVNVVGVVTFNFQV